MRKLFTITCLFCFTLLLIVPLQAQDSGRGLVVIGNPNGSENITTFNPLRCFAQPCTQIGEMLFPKVFAVDNATGLFTPATPENGGLVASWERSDDGTQWRLTLLDGISWSDGAPITAYDVFFSFAAIEARSFDSPYLGQTFEYIEGVVPLNARELIVLTKNQSCDTLYGMQIPVIPAHSYNADFATETADFFTDDADFLAQWEAWEDLRISFRYLVNHPFETEPTIHYGDFHFDEWQRTDFVRLLANDGNLAVEFRDVPSSSENLQLFYTGDMSIMDTVSISRLPDIAAMPDVNTYEYTGLRWDSIVFNLADPNRPKSYRDAKTDELNEQGIHPIFGDVRVRHAIQLAINVDEIIGSALDGHGVPLYADQVPLSWAYDASIAPIAYNFEEAERLLDEAGWYLLPGNRRVCIRCSTAQPDARLTFGLAVDGSSHQWAVARVIQRQLGRLGIAVDVFQDFGVTEQYFDAILMTRRETYPATPDRFDWFNPENDKLFVELSNGENFGSYYNDDLVAIYAAARETCDIEMRRELYGEAVRILHADAPYVWLYAYNEAVAIRGNVQHIDPRPLTPFWNLADWVVWR